MNSKKWLRTLAPAALALLLALGLEACKQPEQPPEDTTPGETTAAETKTPDTDPAEDPTEPAGPVETTAEPDDTEPEETEGQTEPATEPVTERETYPAYADAENAKTINLAAQLANKVTAYYNNQARSQFIIENANARLVYDMGEYANKHRIYALTTPDGKPYFTDSLDTFITLSDGTYFYAGESTSRANLYDQGYYYYDVHILDHTFVDTSAIVSEKEIKVQSPKSTHDVVAGKKPESDGSFKFTIQNPADPYFCYQTSALASEVDAVLVTLRSTKSTRGSVYYVAGSHTTYNADQTMSFSVANDGEYHTYIIPISHGQDWGGTLTGVRLDIGTVAREEVFIKELKLVKFRSDSPRVTLDRNFVAYSDKINDVERFIVDADAAGVAGLGSELRIKADTVAKLIVCDASGWYDDLADVDWPTAEYIGFDIKDVGVFGYILLSHQTSGTLSVELIDGEYVLRQSYAPKGGTLKKGQEVFVGHRLYTDGSHSFDDFIYAAECERHPLEGITVRTGTNGARFEGYDALHGVYEFIIPTSGGFSGEYNRPMPYNAGIEIVGDDKDRPIYINAHVRDGSLECAALLDEYRRMLPVRIEVCKNFAHDGEELYYTANDSVSYGYAIFPMVVEAGNTEKFTICHLYEQWGQYRLKQLSSIRFHQAYYHMSTGVTETNCIAFYNYGNRLPDHRAMSQAYWGDVYFSALDANGNPVGPKTCCGEQPQHENNGTHIFLGYDTADGTSVTTESVWHHIDSSGPTYMDLTMHYITTDGAMDMSLRHVEMPQYDENRAYYELDYRVNRPVSIKNFKNDFQLYAMTTNNDRNYLNLGYLDENNQPVITAASEKARPVSYVLGSEFPYVDYFGLRDTNPKTLDRADVYSNISILIKDYDIVVGGVKYQGPLVITELDGKVWLTLDLGEVTLQPGDYFRVNMILMPWGDSASEDDSNVRLVRENTLLHPIKAASEKDIVMDDVWMAKIYSKNGDSAEFTISGGCDNTDREGYASEGHTKYKRYFDRDYNVTVRVYGFRSFGTPGLYEKINGEWVAVDYASEWGYDGYAVLYDEDNTFSFSFVINMNEAKDRTFRVTVE